MSGISRPTEYVNWTDGDPLKVQAPPASFRLEGWDPGQAPPAEYANWQIYLLDQWVQYLDQFVSPGVPDQVMRLLNGGYYSFDLGTSNFAWSQNANLAIAGVPDTNNIIPAGNVTILDGQIAYVTVNAPIPAKADSVNGNTLLTGVSFTAGITNGMAVTGPGAQAGTTVISKTANTVTLSLPATSNNTQATYIFSDTGTLTVQVADNATFIPNFSTIMIARRIGKLLYVGVNTGQMLLRDGESKVLLGSGYFTVYPGIAGENLLQGELVYISNGNPTDPGRVAGELYKLDTSSTWSPIRGTFAGIIVTDVLAAASVDVMWDGIFSYVGLTIGAYYYADPAVPGGITNVQPTSAGSKVVPVGVALTTTQLLVAGQAASGGQFSQPVFHEDKPTNSGGTTFTLETLPLNDDSIFIFIDGIPLNKSKWSRIAQVITLVDALEIGQEFLPKYVLAEQAYMAGHQEEPTPDGSDPLKKWFITFQPIGKQGLFLFVDSVFQKMDDYTLIMNNDGTATIDFNVALTPGQLPYCMYLSPVGAPGVAGAVGGAVNIGTGFVLYAGMSGVNLKFKSLKAGANVTITDNGTELLISASGGGGPGAPTAYGSLGTPATFTPSAGLMPGPEVDQIWFLGTGAGALPVTAPLQIANGTIIGQRLRLRGVDLANYYIFQDGNGLSLNGNCNITNQQCLTLFWDGAVWYEETRRG